MDLEDGFSSGTSALALVLTLPLKVPAGPSEVFWLQAPELLTASPMSLSLTLMSYSCQQ